MPVSNLYLSSLNGTNGFRITGATLYDRSGFSVSSAGDVNGDGFDDLIVGAFGVGGSSAGAGYVVFGKASGFGSNLDLSALDGANGFRLSGTAADDHAGVSVSGAGDVNGDGYADLIVGAYGVGASNAGASYVVFGKASGFASNLALSTLNGTTGFKLSGESNFDYSGSSVSSAGDVNGDGYDDLIVGANRADGFAGASYVVFGKASGFASNLSLSALDGANGFRLSGVAGSDFSGRSVSGAGDVNGDGFDDLIVGADGADPNGPNSGASYVVFGKASGFVSDLNLAALDGVNGFRLAGEFNFYGTGISVSNAGDVNGDGFGDLIVGAFGAGLYGSAAGASYVVFGKAAGFASDLNLSALDGANGFRLSGAAMSDNAGFSVGNAGDVNGDGFGDLIVGARYAYSSDYHAGASYVVFGKASGFTSNLDLSSLDGANGFKLSGEAADDQSGRSVSGAGDVNGDGFDDLIVGADRADSYAGASYVVYGGDFTGAVTFLGTAGADTLTGTGAAEVFVSAQGNDTLAGGGGAGVFNAGAGNDRIEVASTIFAHMDGGSGVDTLALTGGGLVLNLAALANSRTSGIEIVELTGSGSNTLRLSAADLLDLSDTSNTLRVDGDADDALIKAGDWAFGGTTVIASQTYALYTQGAATLQVDADVATAPGQLSALDGASGFRIAGAAADDQSGVSVGGAGDVNGDGFDDLIVGAYRADPNANYDAGASYVVFGKASGIGSSLGLSALDGSNGFRLAGEAAGDESGRSVSGAGDVNGDGYADLIVGARFADPGAVGNAGAAYVVFGMASGFAPSLDLTALNGANGFRLEGEATNDYSGISVSVAGDVNGDGFGDLIVGASHADVGANGNAGASYVVFGKSSGFASSLNLSSLDGASGFKLSGAEAYDRSGFSVSNAGDVNGDGFDDLVVGAQYAAPGGVTTGASYVVFGKASGFASNLNLSSLDGSNGFRLSGVALGDVSGRSVSNAGDVNGDGFGDLIIGARYADPNGASSGASYVVFGKASGFGSNLDLSALDGSNGFRLAGAAAGDLSGVSVSGAGDVNGDGFGDLIVGAQYADPNGNASGASYVVYGRTSGFASNLDLAALDGANGFKLAGAAAGDQSARSVTGAGDVDGDGFDDLIIGARYADPDGNVNAGAGYVIYGGNFTGAVTHQGTSGADSVTGSAGADVMLSGLGNDTLSGGDSGDVLRGGRGNDSLLGGNGLDTIYGGAGNDDLRGNDQADRIYGEDGNDYLGGGKGLDSLYGGEGNDTLAGLVGNDFLDGGKGIDWADYSGSSDGVTVNLLTGSGGSTVPVVGVGSGIDVLTGLENVLGSGFADNLSGDAGHNALTGGNGNDTLFGDTGFDTLDGGEGDDSLLGGLQKDVVNGGNGNDTVAGGNGFDTIDGGAGNDIIRGALGTDVLTGGSGADRFVFATALDGILNIDTITDFVSGTDVIELSASIFGAYSGQIGNTVGLSANLTYNAGTGVLQYDADGAGGGAEITFAILGTSIHPAVGSDFVITA